jgi:hypothetical protein
MDFCFELMQLPAEKISFLHETCLTIILHSWQTAKHTESGFHGKAVTGGLNHSKSQNIFWEMSLHLSSGGGTH